MHVPPPCICGDELLKVVCHADDGIVADWYCWTCEKAYVEMGESAEGHLMLAMLTGEENA